jgi:hypothetical protein
VAFALFYNMQDMTAMGEAFNGAHIKGNDRNAGRTYWNNGLSDWQSAPRAPIEHPEFDNDPDLRILVVQNNTLAAFRQYLYALYAKYPEAVFLGALADDLTHRLAVVEPWPWVGPPASPWEGIPRQPPPGA